MEAIVTFNQNCFKAAAVLIGGTAESMVLELRDILVDKMNKLNKTVPQQLKDWKVKTIFDQIEKELTLVKKQMPHKLKENFDSFWSALFSQIRMTRNEAGHPTSVAPVTFESVHANLLILPELAKLITEMKEWIVVGYK
ncbi:hypothetical protein [Neobacillus sp. FSL H8-0543]|uniref:hypothetical protein n=1 Tax=Neobacillus sp. FSL H8-0543 TaxID=2954672 RepID=UPI0031581BF9